MSSSTPGGPALGHTGLSFSTVESCENNSVKGLTEGKGGLPQILFKPFVIYIGIYLSLKKTNSTVWSCFDKRKVNSETQLFTGSIQGHL